MKKVFFIAMIMIVTLSFYGLNARAAGFSSIDNMGSIKAPLKRVDITIQSGNYTIHIVGDVTYGASGNVNINATVTISGNGMSLSLPFSYNGALKTGGGTNKNIYSEKGISEEDKPAVSLIVSRLYLPADVDPRKAKLQ